MAAESGATCAESPRSEDRLSQEMTAIQARVTEITQQMATVQAKVTEVGGIGYIRPTRRQREETSTVQWLLEERDGSNEEPHALLRDMAAVAEPQETGTEQMVSQHPRIC